MPFDKRLREHNNCFLLGKDGHRAMSRFSFRLTTGTIRDEVKASRKNRRISHEDVTQPRKRNTQRKRM